MPKTKSPRARPGPKPPASSAQGAEPASAPVPREPRRWERLPFASLAFTTAMLALAFVPPASTNPSVRWAIVGVVGALLAWHAILVLAARRLDRAFRVEFVPVKSHWVQFLVQFSIMLYWGWFWRDVYAELPLILAQVLFVYTLEALVSWSRGRNWRLGFGPLPIVASTNLLLWFKHDWYVFQFLMLATGLLGKQFLTWKRDGKTTHIFNPSAFGQSVVAVVLIATGTTNDFTWGREIASTFEAPHIVLVIFLGGLIVQYLFRVTLMTFAAVATLCLLNLAYTGFTDLYFFVNINIAAPIFLGVHLLITDPATSPRTNVGQLVFGALYAAGYFALFRVFDLMEVPVFWDKLLPVPILNLCVPWIDRLSRMGLVGRWNERWQSAFPPKPLNLVHMGSWIALFATMILTGFIEAPHPGNSIPFWKRAYAEGRPHAGHSLVMAAGAQAVGGGSGAAYNELGLICMEGRIVDRNHGTAARYFAQACELGNANGCANVASQYLFLRERRSDEDVARAFDHLELASAATSTDWLTLYLLGTAYETGRGRPRDPARAIELYERCGSSNLYACKGLARIALSGTPYDLARVAATLQWAAKNGDAESCWYVAYMHAVGAGVDPSPLRARALLDRACGLGSTDACEALKQPELPPFANPAMSVPGWSTAFPMS